MSYQLVWRSEALREFGAIWDGLPTSEKRVVNDAFDSIDHLLTTEPMLEGESRHFDTDRVLVYGPVVVLYRVDLRLRVVRVLKANLARPR